ncbi:CheY-like chemotaxis protein [Methylorubrum pseudosasae]|nr:CheY-like chemotaxis protein [Methylorubrum pseudosasae]
MPGPAHGSRSRSRWSGPTHCDGHAFLHSGPFPPETGPAAGRARSLRRQSGGSIRGRGTNDAGRTAMPEVREGPLRILVVEDEVLIALELECLLEDLGHVSVGVAGSSADAIALGRTALPDVALVDIHLIDGPTGVEVARQLSRDPRVTVVFMTANAKRIPPDFAGALGVIAKALFRARRGGRPRLRRSAPCRPPALRRDPRRLPPRSGRGRRGLDRRSAVRDGRRAAPLTPSARSAPARRATPGRWHPTARASRRGARANRRPRPSGRWGAPSA